MLRIYVANLGKYNEGELVGKWLTLPCTDEELEQLYIDVKVAHRDEDDNFVPYYEENGIIYEETAIHDYESDFNIKVNEYDNIEALNEMAEEIKNLDRWELETLESLLTYYDDVDEALEQIEDVIIWADCDNMTEVAEQYAEETGLLDSIPENLRYYFDFDAFGRDLEIEGTYIFYNGDCYEVN